MLENLEKFVCMRLRPKFHAFFVACCKRMEFDLKLFFKEPPRIKEEVKVYMHDTASRIVKRAVEHIKFLQIERILSRHVRIIIFQMTQDPLTRMTRVGLCVQQSKVKNMAKVFQRTIDSTEENLKGDAKYGGIDKKVVKGTQTILDDMEVRYSTGASVCLAACVAEVCGIMLNSTQTLMQERTINLASLQTYATIHCISSGEKCCNSSLVRFLHHLNLPMQKEIEQTADDVKDLPKISKKSTRESPGRKMRRLEEKSVSFSEDKRPSTPDTCFWED